MAKYICKICGKEFDRVGNGVYCSGPHYRPCIVCGKPVEYVRPSDPGKCCSDKCIQVLSQQSKQKNLGVRKCKECGKLFYPNQASQVYCNNLHIATCVICGREFSYSERPSERRSTCSEACQIVLRDNTHEANTGYRNPASDPITRKKISEKARDPEQQARRIASTLASTGYKYGFHQPEVIAAQHTPEFIEHMYDNYRKRTGYQFPMQDPANKAKQAKTRAEHGPYEMTVDIVAKRITDSSKANNYMQFNKDPAAYIEAHFDHSPTIRELEQDLGVTDTPIYNAVIHHGCRDMLSRSVSSMETEVMNYLNSIVPNIQLVHRDRSIIKPYEIDIYLPEYKVGIECNPSVTHNSSIADPWGGPPKSYDYHKIKSEMAQNAGIFMFHIFGYEWVNKQQIIQSMLANLIHSNTQRLGARATKVRVVNYAEACEFLNNNHRQGALNAKIYLGLYTMQDELVALMTFNHIRSTIGSSKQTSSHDWELSRFCSKLNCNVVGGASKLFQYFIKNYDPERVISYSDIAHTRGDLYDKLGFQYDHTTSPSYVWVDVYDQQYYNRVSCQKNNLHKLFPNEDLDITHHTEREIMESHGFVQLFDCGVKRWIWSKC